MLKNILYATDLGIYGPVILEHVAELAQRYQARVTVIHAVEPVSVLADALLATYVPESTLHALKEHGYEAVLTTIRARVRQAFTEDLSDVGGKSDWLKEVIVIGGDPAQVILEQANHSQSDLIVMGTHSGRSTGSTPIGSVAAKVLQLSRIPIYLVPTAQVPLSLTQL